LLDAINTLHKPPFVGGGADKALPKLEQTIELFAAETVKDSLAPHWGREDALIWAGRSALETGDPAAALGYYARALELNPANGWVRGTLVPEAEKAAAAAATPDTTPQPEGERAVGARKP
jgi:hypothetical protein